MATQSIRIPVELELRNIQEAINSLKGGLKGVSKESGFYKTISKELDQVEKKYRELSAVASRPFTNVSSITSFENQFLRLGDRITNIGKAFSELSFKDLDLKGIPNAEEQFKKLTNQVRQTQKALESVNTNQMQTALSDSTNGLTQAFEKIKQLGHGDLINGESFEKTFSNVSNEIQSVSEKLQQAKLKLEKFKQASIQNTNRLDLFTEVEKQLQNITSKADLLGKIKPIASGAGMTSEQLLDLLGLNKPGLFEGAADKIQTKIGEIIARSKTALTKTSVSNEAQINEQQKQIDGLNNYVAALQDAYAKLERLQNSPATKLELAGALKGVETARQNLDNFMRSCLEASTASNSAGDALGLVGESASSASPKIRAAENELRRLGDAARSMDQLKSRMAYFFSFYKVMGTVRKAVNDAVTTIKELDSVMTEIAVVTKMTQQDLWDQVGAYSAIANEYGVTIKGVYEVSQLYYQQGLQTAEVMDLTVETLKMAKIAGLDYATATDYMTVAVRGFKMEMAEAQRVTDVYSALAAGTASDVEELAVAMSKTASSAEAVGSSFESTSAMIATMVSITREAPENFSGAYKKIA